MLKRVKIMTIPFWVYFVVAGILMSAFMAIKTGKEERIMEQENIQREGEIFMERLEKEKEERKQDVEDFKDAEQDVKSVGLY
ncbi:hypothetical protein B1NLA3E_03845 [Bacillus sp. 1NLA3E]|nr:hypothetical protein B1NLA3E_03845 [Bacillus sp. 1NLA3E]